ncbi:hypothetical protein PMAYCL1PPCAC_14939, partial [Pristionchus mayeri]
RRVFKSTTTTTPKTTTTVKSRDPAGGRKKRSASVTGSVNHLPGQYPGTPNSTASSSTLMTLMPTTTGGGKLSTLRTPSATTRAPAGNVTIDLPGYGSCEYANRNFRGASECIK